ncbi:class I SAM-dependent methyltransferase [Rhodobacteraceae bacterium S2214]|nr:class I SAM-dependent methyltransferase [Rhodobacteraceae bacterium S2214]
MIDDETIAFYDTAAGDYAAKFAKSRPDAQLTAFMDLLPNGGRVLDLGCGPATASAHMRNAGFDCDPVDASDGMIKIANNLHDLGARKLTFDELDMIADYDGVWANFSLLHASRDDLPRHLNAIAIALRDQGVFSVAMKTGTDATRDRLGRMYTFVTIPELSELLTNASFSILAVDEGMGPGLAGDVSPWVTIRARKD